MPTQPDFLSRQLSRRNLLKAAGAILIAPSIGCKTTAPAPDDDLRARAKALLDSTLSIDIHSHVGGTSLRKPVDDFPKLKASGLSAVCMSLVSDNPVLGLANGKLFARRQPLPGELYQHMLERMDFADRMIQEHHLKRITTLADLRESKASKTVGVVLATEGGDFLDGKLERLEMLHERGVRHFQLVHYRAGNGIGDIQTEQPVDHGATAYGLDLVRACNRLGMVVDVAHATFETVKQIAEVVNMPLVLSHTAFVSVPKKLDRRIDATHAKLIADTGGVVGIWTSAGSFLDVKAFARGVVNMADIVGVDHVGIGTDMNGLVHPMMSSYEDFPDLVGALFQYFREDEMRKILGGNYLRVFDKVTAIPTRKLA